jgi:ankyrin repeat protein
MNCFRWLVLNTGVGEGALVPVEGQRSLLHSAASYGNTQAVKWLSSELGRRQIGIDGRDTAGLTALHMAAKAGHISTAHELIRAGADPLSQVHIFWSLRETICLI